MNLDDLRSTQVDERGTDSLQPLRPSFYEDAAAYLADLRERRDQLAERVDNPFDSEEVRRLTDELETAQEVVEAIYDRRVGKLVKRASLAAAGMPADEEGLTQEERELFGDLVERIEANRTEVLAILEGETSITDEGSIATEPATDDPGASISDAVEEAVDTEAPPDVPSTGGSPEIDVDQEPEPDGGSAAPEPEGSTGDPADDAERLTVRITTAVGEIYGVDDRVYTLDAEDVVRLPAPNARPLLERGAAQRVE